MKFNWGTGLIITFMLFAGGMIFLFTLCTKQNEDLVSKDYYNQEIAYQRRIDARENALKLSEPVVLNYDYALKNVNVIFPAEFKSKQITGTLLFFRPDDASLDFSIAISTTNAVQTIQLSTMKNGLWRAQLQWEYDSRSYYDEQNLVIN